ncbi:MAG: leucyl aminopeptidase, partial [Lentisphaeria bacterium]
MEFTAKTADILTFKTQCAVVFALNESLLASAELVDAVHQGILSKLIKKGDLEAYPGKCAWVQVPASSKEQPYERVLLVHLGKGEHHTGAIKKEAWVAAIKGCSKALEARPVKDAALFLDDLTINTEAENSSQTLAELAAINITRSHYRYTRTKTKAKNLPTLKKLTIACASSEQRNAAKLGIKTGQGIGIGINAARELGNLPSNICTPTYLAELAKGFEEECKPLRVKVLNEKQMEKLGMGSLLSVTRGAEEEAKLIIMEYKNNPKASRPHVLVGKGITFDTGGISLKAGSGMDEMKFDMCGAASVFGTLA